MAVSTGRSLIAKTLSRPSAHRNLDPFQFQSPASSTMDSPPTRLETYGVEPELVPRSSLPGKHRPEHHPI